MSPLHGRHYSLEEANAALPRVIELMATLRSASERLGDKEARDALGEAAPGNGGGQPGRTVSEAFIELRDAMAEQRESEIVLRDLDRGLIDFPSMRGDEEIYLCWEEGEPEIAFWHEPETGFAGRRPIEGG